MKSGFGGGSAAQCGEHFLDVSLHIDFGKDGLEAAGCVDDEGLAFGPEQTADDRQAAEDRPVGAIGALYGSRVVREQVEGQVEFLAELPVGVRVVRADSDDYGVGPIHRHPGVPESASFDRAVRRVVLGIKIQHDLLPAQRL